MRKEYENNSVVKHSIEFSLMIIKYVHQLENDRKFIIAKQVLRSGTSIGASVIEAQGAESKADFIHKLKIADKEAMKHGTGFIYVNNQTDIFMMRVCIIN